MDEQTTQQNPVAKKILLAEDDNTLAQIYQMRLEAEGFVVQRAHDGEEVLALAVNFHPDLIILDTMMPKVSGLEALDILRNTPETANTKIIMLTALGQESDKAKAESLGADDYLVKSQVAITDIVSKIKNILKD